MLLWRLSTFREAENENTTGSRSGGAGLQGTTHGGSGGHDQESCRRARNDPFRRIDGRAGSGGTERRRQGVYGEGRRAGGREGEGENCAALGRQSGEGEGSDG